MAAKETLKKPSHFQDVGTKSGKQTNPNSPLIPPAMFFNNTKELHNSEVKKPQNMEVKKSQPLQVKKPSDFVLNTESAKLQPVKFIPCERGIETGASYPVKFFNIKCTPNTVPVTIPPHAAFNIEIFNLKDTVKSQKQEILICKRQLDVGKLHWHDTEKNLKTELEKAEMKITNMQKKLDETETKSFMETKSIYEKFFSLQTKYDKEKEGLEEKTSSLEEKLFMHENEKENLIRILQREKEEITTLLKSLKEIEVENEVIKAKYDERLSQANAEIERLKHENYMYKITESQLAENYQTLEKVMTEKETSLQEIFAVNKELKSSIILQSETISNLETKIGTLEEELKSCLIEKQTFEQQVSNNTRENEKLKSLLDALNSEKETTKQELCSIKTEFEIAKQLQSQYQEYEKTCKTLQLTNRQLNVRLDTVNEMLQLQESVMNQSPFNSQNEKLLQTWRCKVYQLLVLLKSKDI